jgi:UDP:flavonoid glycosyltransferase YjiC (YdhE family)
MNPSVAFFAMSQEGHFQGLRPLISGLAGRGLTPYVFTDRDYRVHVERAGGRFVDLFAKRPLERADCESDPAPCRFVSFAGRYAGEILDELNEIQPSLIVHDQHAVIGRAVGAALGIPYVTVCPAHNVTPDRLPELLASLPRISISTSCSRAVAVLQGRYGLRDASPFSFASGLSPFLNVYGEPAAFLSETEKRALEPVVFHGCLPSAQEIESKRPARGSRYFGADEAVLKVYVAFGTVVWRYWPREALDALTVISDSLAGMPQVRALISLGGAEVGAEGLRALEKPNVSVTAHADQWNVLQEADAFVTHNGLKSTHEAIFHGVPMISYPIFWDQPALAGKCRAMGVAIPLTGSPRGRLIKDYVHAALTELSGRRESLRTALAEARDRELQVIEDRDSVLHRITDLIHA